MIELPVKQDVFTLKGRLFTLTVLHLYAVAIDEIAAQCDYLINKAPKLFEYAPIVISLAELKHEDIDFAAINEVLRRYRLIPVAVQDANEAQQVAAKAAGFAIIKASRKDDDGDRSLAESSKSTPKASKTKLCENKLVTSPVRSGQQVYAQGGDLIVLSSVSHGAELLADGNIHVYGALRGRALAGIKGNTEARIFCHQLNAELLSIAGQYIINETINQQPQLGAKQVYLTQGRLHIDAL